MIHFLLGFQHQYYLAYISDASHTCEDMMENRNLVLEVTNLFLGEPFTVCKIQVLLDQQPLHLPLHHILVQHLGGNKKKLVQQEE